MEDEARISGMTDKEEQVYLHIVTGTYHRRKVVLGDITKDTGISLIALRTIISNLIDKGYIDVGPSVFGVPTHCYIPVKAGVDTVPQLGSQLMTLAKWMELWNQKVEDHNMDDDFGW